jgi:alanine racemase
VQNIGLVMSHLACASEPENPKNVEQLRLFQKALKHFPGIPASFANSSGILLGNDYHFDLARPGAALYGISRNPAHAAVTENVATLSAPVLQYHHIETPVSVGYGATVVANAGSVLATLELGYADGMLRTLGNKGAGFVGNIRVPIIGHVSMDMIIVDVTAVPEHLRTSDLRVEFIGKAQSVNALAAAAGTIGYEMFTRLGARVRRIYT